MHSLTRCQQCLRQYDTEGHTPGDKFHCLCGERLTVPEHKEFEGSVVRCSSCGGTREKGHRSCQHCGADFTLIEQDLNTTCPACFARISDHAKFCHHCATPIAVSGKLGRDSDKTCPNCRGNEYLASRTIQQSDLSLLECNICAGIWLDKPVFLALERSVINMAAEGVGGEHDELRGKIQQQSTGDQNLYRKCPECSKLMHRRNYGPGSGIIIDQCHRHGFWFDGHELDVLLRWIRTGGLLAAQERRTKIQKDNDRLEKLLKRIETTRNKWNPKGKLERLIEKI